jgi:DNA-binding SARP family transcriptional activator
MARAAEGFGTALELWRGPAFADVENATLQAASASLEERRLMALENKAECNLALGRYERVIAEASGQRASRPLRERLRALLMLALYYRGCRTDALAVYRVGRRILVDELGLEPGPELRRLHSAILSESPDLARPHRFLSPVNRGAWQVVEARPA